jgi:hypothetical protein
VYELSQSSSAFLCCSFNEDMPVSANSELVITWEICSKLALWENDTERTPSMSAAKTIYDFFITFLAISTLDPNV